MTPYYNLVHDGTLAPLVAKLKIDLEKNHVGLCVSGSSIRVSYNDDNSTYHADGEGFSVMSVAYVGLLSNLLEMLGMPYDAQVLPEREEDSRALTRMQATALAEAFVEALGKAFAR